MKSIRWLLFCLALLLIVPSGIQAQSDEEPWSIVEQCISMEINPPPDWTFDGTLILSSSYRVHTFRQGWTTPRIVAFYRDDVLSYALSPDGRWFGVVVGSSDIVNMSGTFRPTEINVFSTIDDTFYSIPWRNTYSGQHYVFGHRLYWADNTHLLYSTGDWRDEAWFLIDPLTSEIIPWDRSFDPSGSTDFTLAPDGQKALWSNWPGGLLFIDTDESEIEVRNTASWGIWHPSSDYFLTQTFPEDHSNLGDLLMLDLNGDIVHDIYDTQESVHSSAWSYDGRYLAFVDDHLYIADLDTQQVIDTCIASNATLAWSPTQNQLAVVGGNRDRAIRIIDFDRGASYIVGYHGGGIIGWRADD
jgi:hypothetical protein